MKRWMLGPALMAALLPVTALYGAKAKSASAHWPNVPYVNVTTLSLFRQQSGHHSLSLTTISTGPLFILQPRFRDY